VKTFSCSHYFGVFVIYITPNIYQIIELVYQYLRKNTGKVW